MNQSNADHLVALGESFRESHSAFVSEALAERALASNPDHLDAMLLYAASQAKLGRSERALEWFARAAAGGDENAGRQYAAYRARLESDSSREPFDYLVVPPGRAGYLALEMMLALHPGVLPVPSWRLERALADGVEQRLPGELASIRRRNPGGVMGFIKHMWVAGLDAPDEIAERTARIVNRRLLIVMVREPKATLRSMLNHYACRRTFDGIFTHLGLPWLDGCPWNGRAWGKPLSSVVTPVSYPKPDLEDMLFKALKGLHYDRISGVYARHFDTMEVVDGTEISPGGAREGMPRVLALIGADSSFWHPHFDILHNAQPQRWMRINIATLDIEGMSLRVRLGYRHEAAMIGDDQWFEGARTPATDEMREIGLQDVPHVVMVNRADWCALSPETRRRILVADAFQSFLESLLLPVWLDHYRYAADWLKPLLIDTLPDSWVNKLNQDLGDDTERLLKAHPHLERKWYR